MHPLKIVQLSVLILPAYFYGLSASVFLDPCFPAFKGQSCNMTCRVQDFSQVIDFSCNGTSRGACLPGVYCNPSIIAGGGGKTLYFQIPSLSYASDSCNWTCTYGSTSSSISDPIIFSGYTGSLILTNQTNEDKINLTATAECVYPYNTTVRIQYREEQDTSGQYQSLTQQVDVQSFHVPGNCGFDIEKRIVATHEVSKKNSGLGGKSVYLRMEFLQYLSATPNYTNDVGPFTFEKSTDSKGLTTTSSSINSDMSTTVSEPLSTMSSDMSTTVSEVPPPLVTTSSADLSQEIVITITISSIIAAGVLMFLTVLVVNLCRQKHRQTPAKKPKENHLATKQDNFTKKDALKSSTEPRIKLSGKRNTKQESISLDKFEHTQFNNSQAPKNRMYEHNPQTTDYMYLNNIQNQHVFNHSYAGRNMIPYGNQHDSYPKSHSRPNHNQLYQYRYPEHPGQNTGMFQYYRADNLYQGQQMYQRPYDALYDSQIIDNKEDDNRRSKGRAYEKNWDLLY